MLATSPRCCLGRVDEGTNGFIFAATDSNPLPWTLGHPGSHGWEAHGWHLVGCGWSIQRHHTPLHDGAGRADKTLSCPRCNISRQLAELDGLQLQTLTSVSQCLAAAGMYLPWAQPLSVPRQPPAPAQGQLAGDDAEALSLVYDVARDL